MVSSRLRTSESSTSLCGSYSDLLVSSREDPLNQETQYSPTDKEAMIKEYRHATRMLQPHSILLAFLASRFQSFRYRDSDLVHACLRLVLNSSLVSERWRYSAPAFFSAE